MTKFNSYKKNSLEFLDFGPGFICMSPDKNNKYLKQHIATKLKLDEMVFINILNLKHKI